MKKLILIIILSIFAIGYLCSQDVIIKKNGDKISCKVTGVDSANVYLTIILNKKEIKTFVDKHEIKSIIYARDLTIDTTSDSIMSEKKGAGYRYYLKGKVLSLEQLSVTLKSNPQAYVKIEKAKGSKSFANILAYAGGFMIGFPIGTAIAGGKPNWTLAGIGEGCILIMIPVLHSAENQTKQAVDIYNGGLKSTAIIRKDLRFGLTNNGIGLYIRF